jgi:hypothetical protein
VGSAAARYLIAEVSIASASLVLAGGAAAAVLIAGAHLPDGTSSSFLVRF